MTDIMKPTGTTIPIPTEWMTACAADCGQPLDDGTPLVVDFGWGGIFHQTCHWSRRAPGPCM